ncbi:MAG: hypothetical protein DI589_12090 [Shinella sp.]|nr:MAG: hypothetical protein DI589_12090 [Shinella sp.]
MTANPIGKNTVENLSGASKTELADYSSADYNFTVTTRAIHVNVDGTASVVFEGDGATARSLVLVGGVTYPYRLKTIKNSGTTAGMGILGLL